MDIVIFPTGEKIEFPEGVDVFDYTKTKKFPLGSYLYRNGNSHPYIYSFKIGKTGGSKCLKTN